MMFTCITMLCAWCPEKISFTKSFVDHSVWFANLERGCAKKQSNVKNAAPCSSGDDWPRRKLAAYAWMKKTACDSSIWTSVRLTQTNSTNHKPVPAVARGQLRRARRGELLLGELPLGGIGWMSIPSFDVRLHSTTKPPLSRRNERTNDPIASANFTFVPS